MRRHELRDRSCEPESGARKRWGVPAARRSKLAARKRGFTILELTVVILVMMMLMVIAVPLYERHITHTREVVLRENLSTLNKLVDQYALDKKKAPQSLDDLVQAGYLKFIPNDITGKPDTWKTDPEDPQSCMDPNQCGIGGVHSGSQATASDGTAYSNW